MADSTTVRITRTSIGRKLLMAAASLVLIGFVVVHLLGNLKLFTGAASFNDYAHWLRVAGKPLIPEGNVLWIARVVLLGAVLVHVGEYLRLRSQSRRARGTRYARYHPEVLSWTSRAMMWGGLAILAFVVFHVLHLTTGNLHPDFDAADPYTNVVTGFRSGPVAAAYIVGAGALGMHLYHGLWSLLQTLGVTSRGSGRYRRPAAAAAAVAITIGYVSLPLAVLAGVIG